MKSKPADKITKEKIEKYRALTSNALKIAEKSVVKDKESEAREIISMVSNYLSDLPGLSILSGLSCFLIELVRKIGFAFTIEVDLTN